MKGADSEWFLQIPFIFSLSCPIVLSSNTVSNPPRSSPLTTITEAVIYFGASTEPYIAHYLKRHFWWYRCELWAEDIPPHIDVIVALSMDDEIVDSHLVANSLEVQKETAVGGMDNIKVVKLEGHHAKCLYTPSTWSLLTAELKAVEKRKAE